jgi:shikimate kinase
MVKHLFIIGPGGAGKSTCGKLLAETLKIPFIDLDSEFMTQIGSIGSYIKTKGYGVYCQENSNLFYKLLKEADKQTIFILSSGFLTYEIDNLKEKNLTSIDNLGQSILLMPSDDFETCAKVIVSRQLKRGFGLNKETETRHIKERFYIYRDLGDIQIFSTEPPELIIERIIGQLKLTSKPNDSLI